MQYDLIQVNQSLGIVSPDSELWKTLQPRRAAIQSEIERLEAEQSQQQTQEDGKVKIWAP